MSRHGYPRPQLERKHWTSLNGEWDFALDPENAWTHPNDVKWSAKIHVPFAPETQASGIGNTGFFRAVWYRRTIEQPRLQPGSRTLIHFGAVDYKATVWINGCEAVTHEGGRSEEHTSELQSLAYLVCRLLLEKKKRASKPPSDPRPSATSVRS